VFKRIDHVEIVTDQLDRTVEFYIEVLGFTVKARDRIERSGLGVPIDLVYLDLGGTVVELIAYNGTHVDPAPRTEHLGYRMIALEVDNMEKTADYLRTKGVAIVWGQRFARPTQGRRSATRTAFTSSLGSGSGEEMLSPRVIPYLPPRGPMRGDGRRGRGTAGVRIKGGRASKILYRGPPTAASQSRVKLWVLSQRKTS
jgi:catechol 2,3-dioxygenase-like lactoylglutathione lyase family enzyme